MPSRELRAASRACGVRGMRARPLGRGLVLGLTDEQRQANNLVALFSYSNLPAPLPGKETQPIPAPLELEIDTVKKTVRLLANVVDRKSVV